jgi:hypothetical protein
MSSYPGAKISESDPLPILSLPPVSKLISCRKFTSPLSQACTAVAPTSIQITVERATHQVDHTSLRHLNLQTGMRKLPAALCCDEYAVVNVLCCAVLCMSDVQHTRAYTPTNTLRTCTCTHPKQLSVLRISFAWGLNQLPCTSCTLHPHGRHIQIHDKIHNK